MYKTSLTEPGLKLKHPFIPQKPRDTTLEGWEEFPLTDHIVPPPGQHSTMQEVSP